MLRRIRMCTAFRLAEKMGTSFSFCTVPDQPPLRRDARTAAFVFVLTLFDFRKIVDTQLQKIDAHTLGGNA
jgi:hypothetical protein